MEKNYLPLVSVIMPIHNRFDLVEEAIESIVNQRYRPIELIIIDDCSDEVFNYESIRKGVSIVIYRLKTNSGPGRAREFGRSKFNGEFLCYMDSDDICHEDKFLLQVETLKASPNVGMCYSQTSEFLINPLSESILLRLNNVCGYGSFFPVMFSGRPWSTGSCMWTKEAIQKIGPWVDSWHWEDYAYDFVAGCLGIKIKFIPIVLYFKRQDHNIDRLSNRSANVAEVDIAISIRFMADTLLRIKDVPQSVIDQFKNKYLKANIKKLIRYDDVEIAKEMLIIMLQLTEKHYKRIIIKILFNTLQFIRCNILRGLWKTAFKYLI